jgi:hypothetical protein
VFYACWLISFSQLCELILTHFSQTYEKWCLPPVSLHQAETESPEQNSSVESWQVQASKWGCWSIVWHTLQGSLPVWYGMGDSFPSAVISVLPGLFVQSVNLCMCVCVYVYMSVFSSLQESCDFKFIMLPFNLCFEGRFFPRDHHPVISNANACQVPGISRRPCWVWEECWGIWCKNRTWRYTSVGLMLSHPWQVKCPWSVFLSFVRFFFAYYKK